MVSAGNKAKCLSLANHTTKTIDHHHHLSVAVGVEKGLFQKFLCHSTKKITNRTLVAVITVFIGNFHPN